MPRISNARIIADIEYVLEAPSLGSGITSWRCHGVDCQRDRHRFESRSYSFSFEVIRLTFQVPTQRSWVSVLVSETWHFADQNAQPRTSKSFRVLKGRGADVLEWMRKNRDSKLKGVAVTTKIDHRR